MMEDKNLDLFDNKDDDINALQNKIDNLQVYISTMQNILENFQTNLDLIQTNISNLEGKIIKVEAIIDNQLKKGLKNIGEQHVISYDKITALEKRLEKLQFSFNLYETATNSNIADIKKIKTFFNS